MVTTNSLSILQEFSEYPKLRYISLSADSAEKFYHELLNERFAEAYQKGEKLEVDIDHTAGYTSSFLDEAFGNLVYDFTLNVVQKHLVVKSLDEPYWKNMLTGQTFPEWEERRKKKQEPKKTASHQPWYRLIDNSLQKKAWITNS